MKTLMPLGEEMDDNIDFLDMSVALYTCGQIFRLFRQNAYVAVWPRSKRQHSAFCLRGPSTP